MVALDSDVRASLSEFKEIFDTDPNKGGISDDGLAAYLNAAHDVVDARASGTYDEGKLTRLEKFLAADLATAQDPLVTSKQVADVRASYQRADSGTDYGRIVLTLDTENAIGGLERGSASIETYGPGR